MDKMHDGSHHSSMQYNPLKSVKVIINQNEIKSAKTAKTEIEKRQSLANDQNDLLTFKIKTAAKRRYSTRSPRSHSSAFFT